MTQTIKKNNISEITNYILSIQVSLNGLSFCVLNQENEVLVLDYDNFGIQLSPQQVLDKIKYTLDHHPKLKYEFSTIEIIYQNDLYTFVPKALFDPQLLNEYLSYNIKILDSDFIAYDELEQHDIVTVYIPYTNINNFFFETFGSFTFKHSSTILVDNILTKEKNNESILVYSHMNFKYFDLVVVNKGKLILSNSYIYENKDDFLYYLMFTAEQLRLNPEEFQLIFLGNISKNSDYYTIADKYIRNINFGHRNHTYKLPETMHTIEPHQHFVLLSHF
ncbi:DUF3822 family protein [Aquimarina sp. RZ0]|uniref:DUF3822 family protein n=1 Tax=Aquimarina sp. RZ0 TaxID=2607730 RepID=UPI0011F1A743|nr:DUF3822 family protein [Aquimarina sp. RZ0]KAA1244699.1 DUF3822 family protein [Aquimarina sp. RZ0]